MSALTTEVVKLLDKLYNLRGEDSVILAKMEEEKHRAEETKLRTSYEKETLTNKINSLVDEEIVLKEQGQRLQSVLEGINEDDFSVVLDKLSIDFNPQKIKNKLDETLPETINKVVTETSKAEEELDSIENEMNDAITKIEELGIRKDTALAHQEKLNEYFELALNGNINITRDAITSLLEKFGFTEEEQREAAKILMFPEDALYDYDNDKKGGKSISEVIAEARDFSNELFDSKENNEEKEEIKNVMTENGLDYLDYTSNDLNKIAENYNEDTMKKNVEFIKKHNIETEIFADNVELLNDKELVGKMELLFALGKTSMDIYLNPAVLTKYDYVGLEHAIDLLTESGLDPKNVPLMAF